MKCGHCKRPHDTVAEVRACSQGVLIHYQLEQQLGAEMKWRAEQNVRMRDLFPNADLGDHTEVKRLLKTQDLPDGIYWLGVRIIKVLVAIHGSGNKYGKELVIQEYKTPEGEVLAPPSHEWQMRPGILNDIVRRGKRMTLEEAKQFGAIYGFCCQCGRTLTNEQSIEAGIGPICAGKFAS